MGIHDESDMAANLQIGPTTEGMVRLYVEGDGFSIPMDFDPEEAEEIAEELRIAADQARRSGKKGRGKPGGGGGGQRGGPPRDGGRGRR